MTAIADLKIEDFRPKLKRANWSIGTRRRTLYFTVHYNGPAVKAFGYVPGERSQLQFDAEWHMRPHAFGTNTPGDGIQYHGATLSNGVNVQLRDWPAKLWHSGNAEGNNYSIAWHLPLGGNQRPTAAQLGGLQRVIEAFRKDYSIALVNVRGHNYWRSTECPGDYVSEWLANYRTAAPIREPDAPPRPFVWYKTIVNANCRTAPDVHNSDVVFVTPAGTVFAVDAIVEDGAPYNGETAYVHRADHYGFYHLSVVAPA